MNRAPEGAAGGLNVHLIEQLTAKTMDRLPGLALLGTVGLMALSGYAVPSQPAEASDQQHGQQTDHKSEKRKPRKDCTTFRIAPKDIYAGSGCGAEGATAETVGDGHLEKGWSYSAIVTDGVKKCFFVRQGVLPAPSVSDPAQLATCAAFYPKLVEQKRTYLRKFNCDFLATGIQGCRSGTFYTPITADCKDDRVFRNYATVNATPWNADGKAPAGFSQAVKNSQGRKAVSYRVEIKDTGEGGHDGAVVIRSLKKSSRMGRYETAMPRSEYA